MNFAKDFIGFCEDVLLDVLDLHFAGGVFIFTSLFLTYFWISSISINNAHNHVMRRKRSVAQYLF